MECMALVHNDSFPAHASAWLGFNGTHPFHGSDHGRAVSVCGEFGTLLGGFGVLGRGGWLSRTLELRHVEHSALRLQLGFVKIDSWNNEEAHLFVDDSLVWSMAFAREDGVRDACGTPQATHRFGIPWWEVQVDIDITIPHSSDVATLLIATSLDEDSTDESWGLAYLRTFALGTNAHAVPPSAVARPASAAPPVPTTAVFAAGFVCGALAMGLMILWRLTWWPRVRGKVYTHLLPLLRYLLQGGVLHTPHSTLHTPHSTLHTPHSTLRTPHSALRT